MKGSGACDKDDKKKSSASDTKTGCDVDSKVSDSKSKKPSTDDDEKSSPDTFKSPVEDKKKKPTTSGPDGDVSDAADKQKKLARTKQSDAFHDVGDGVH